MTLHMRKLILFPLVLLVALNAFGHAGEVHKYMGTITALHDDGSFMFERTDGKTIHVKVSIATKYRKSDGRAAKSAELSIGKRAVVTISKDGKTASEVKLAAPKKK
jgi:hypothetical protein